MSTEQPKKPLSPAELEFLATRFKLLGEPMRLRILEAVCHEAKTVSEIVQLTGSTQANVSKHLSLLATGGILFRKREGQCVYYGIKDALVMQLCIMVRSQLQSRQPYH